MESLEIRGKVLNFPAFFPDATFGFVRGVDIKEVVNAGIKGLVVNAYHLLSLAGEINKKNGIGNYMGFPGVIISDSGGFQLMSLIHDLKSGEINDKGATFFIDTKKILLTPENCVKLQILINSDIVMCLDDCTRPNISLKEQEDSVKRTIAWARRCKSEFDKLTENLSKKEKPLIFGIIQGGNDFNLRKKCADELIKIGFDGYAFGGFPVDKNGSFLHELLEYTSNLIPENKIKYAMGIGKPEDIVFCVKIGYNLFDCVIPTREARNNRLYSFKKNLFGKLKKLDKDGNFYEYVRIRNLDNKDNKNPISKMCDCFACKNFSRAHIYKFFKEKNPYWIKLATIHNLRFYSTLMERLMEKQLK